MFSACQIPDTKQIIQILSAEHPSTELSLSTPILTENIQLVVLRVFVFDQRDSSKELFTFCFER